MYLVSHYHETPITKTITIFIVFLVSQTHDLLDVLYFLIFHYLIMRRFAHIEQFSSKGEDAEVVTAYDAQTRLGKRLGRISFCEDKRAIFRPLASCVIRIREFSHPVESVTRVSRRFERKQLCKDLCCLLLSPLASSWSDLNLAQFRTRSPIPDLATFALGLAEARIEQCKNQTHPP